MNERCDTKENLIHEERAYKFYLNLPNDNYWLKSALDFKQQSYKKQPFKNGNEIVYLKGGPISFGPVYSSYIFLLMSYFVNDF